MIIQLKKQKIFKNLYYCTTLRFFAKKSLNNGESKIEDESILNQANEEEEESTISTTDFGVIESKSEDTFIESNLSEDFDTENSLIDVINVFQNHLVESNNFFNYFNYNASELEDHIFSILNEQNNINFDIIFEYLKKLIKTQQNLSTDSYLSTDFANDVNLILLKNLYPISSTNLPALEHIFNLPSIFDQNPGTIAILNTIVFILIKTENISILKTYLSNISELTNFTFQKETLHLFLKNLPCLKTYILTLTSTISDLQMIERTIPAATGAGASFEDTFASLIPSFKSSGKYNLDILYNYAKYLVQNDFNGLQTIIENINVLPESQRTILDIVNNNILPSESKHTEESIAEILNNNKNIMPLLEGKDFISIFELIRQSNIININETMSSLKQNTDVFTKLNEILNTNLESTYQTVNNENEIIKTKT